MKKVVLSVIVSFFIVILLILFFSTHQQQKDEHFINIGNINKVNSKVKQYSILITSVITSVLTEVDFAIVFSGQIQMSIASASPHNYDTVVDKLVPIAPISSSMDMYTQLQRKYWNDLNKAMHEAIQKNTPNSANILEVLSDASLSVSIMDYYTGNLLYAVANNLVKNDAEPLYINNQMPASQFLTTMQNDISTTFIQQLFPQAVDDHPCNRYFLLVQNMVQSTVDNFNSIATTNAPESYKLLQYAHYIDGQEDKIAPGNHGHYFMSDNPDVVCKNGYTSYSSDYIADSVDTYICN